MSQGAASPAYRRLLDWLRARGSALVAFSGGVDSSLVAVAAHDALGPRALAVTLQTQLTPAAEVEAARALAADLGLRHRVVALDALAQPEVRANQPARCYHCKRALFGALCALARAEGLAAVLDGTQADDRLEDRPGQRALLELGVASPLLELGLGKRAVRRLLGARGLRSADRPAAACLATRIPFGQELDPARLRRVEQAEAALRALGFEALRVRDHRELARVELPLRELRRALGAGLRERLVAALRQAGYVYATLDLRGLRSGSAGEALRPPKAGG
ncbi:MAG TPA: ATP-dependent sacrificial sulfur transferase LarE [Myxococcota bacterium]|nr:ATP-dependent sacrificial sulfur transferase LarE [Myxococcota bacterium]HRY95673.1 ATP-dependent sacrificial sulfur transferase LarE [Myxococcota bacterium]HSA24533.1 ATP-dependent sacrificial sulfur transferase LarE [Myxococcota bacterium]